jgi:hypothetical protein
VLKDLTMYLMSPNLVEFLLRENFPPGSPQHSWVLCQAAQANVLIVDRFIHCCTGKRYLWPGTRIVTEKPQPEWFVQTLLLLCKVLNVTQKIIGPALEDFLHVVPDTVEDRGIRSECWHQWCWDLAYELRARVLMLDEVAHGAEHLQETYGLNETWLREHVKESMATAALDPPLDAHGVLVRLQRERAMMLKQQGGVSAIQHPNDERDRFLMSLRRAGVPLKQIATRAQAQNPDWNSLEGASGAQKALDAFCDRHGIPRLRRQEAKARELKALPAPGTRTPEAKVAKSYTKLHRRRCKSVKK